MKKLVLGLTAMIGVAGLFAAKSMTYAGETKRVQTVESWTQEGDEAAWDAWRENLLLALESDERYVTAEAAAEAYDGEDEDERAALIAILDKIHRKTARDVYEDHFGLWEGDAEELDDLLGREVNNFAQACADFATEECGFKGVKSVTVVDTDDEKSCKIECKKAKK